MVDLSAQVAVLRDEKAAAVEIKKWEPKGGKFVVFSTGDIGSGASPNSDAIKFGACRETKDQAEKAAIEMRKFNRLLAYRDEFCPDYVPDWSNRLELKHYVLYDHSEEKYKVYTFFYSPCEVFFPKEAAYELAEKLNSGEVVL